MAIKPAITSVRVFTDAERAAIITGYETILHRTSSSQIISATARKFPYIQSSPIQKSFISISSTDHSLRLIKNGTNIDILLCEGENLSPFYISYYLSQLLKSHNMDCEFINNCFIFKTDNETDTLSVGTANENDGKTPLYLDTVITGTGVDGENGYSGSVSVSGIYTGMTNDTYWIMCSGNNIFTVTPNPSNIYKGSIEVAGTFLSSSSINYTIAINTTNGNIANQGWGFTPKFTVSSTDTDDTPVACDLLSYGVWYEIGNKGVKIRFTEYPFGNGDSFTIDCLAPQTADGTNNTANSDEATFIVMSNEGVIQSPTLLTYVDDPYTPYYKLTLEKGLEVNFESGTFTKGDTFVVKAYMDTYYEYGDVNLGLIGTGEVGGCVGVRVIIKEGAYKLDWCKIGFSDKKEIVSLGYNKTEMRSGTVGKVKPKNTNEAVTTSNPVSIIDQFNYYLNYWEVGYYFDLGCGDPVFASDPLYFIFKAGEEELTQLITPSFNIYYSYK
jgi:hypothetical protein